MSYSLNTTVQFNPANESAFGTLETAELTPVVQLDFVYGINSQTGVSTVANAGTVDTNNSRLRLQSGVNSAGSAIFQSRRIVKYRPGQGMVARFTAAFTTGDASSTQIVGVGNANDGYFFGYNGTAFGILHRNGGSDTWIAQSSWNGDKANGSGASAFTLDPTKGNVFQIKYPYLGYGDILFFIEDSVSGRFIHVHTIRYTNSSASVQLANPNLSFYARSLNAGATTNKIIYVGSVGCFISGARSFVSSPKWATDHNKSGITAETNILSIRNATTYNGVTNRSLIRLQSLAIGAQNTNQVAVTRLRIGATIVGAQTFNPISGSTADNGVTITSGNSIASVDTAGAGSSGGTLLYNVAQNSGSGSVIDLTPFDLFVAPGETLTFGGFATGITTFAIAVNWAEDI